MAASPNAASAQAASATTGSRWRHGARQAIGRSLAPSQPSLEIRSVREDPRIALPWLIARSPASVVAGHDRLYRQPEESLVESAGDRRGGLASVATLLDHGDNNVAGVSQIGRASCRERV